MNQQLIASTCAMIGMIGAYATIFAWGLYVTLRRHMWVIAAVLAFAAIGFGGAMFAMWSTRPGLHTLGEG